MTSLWTNTYIAHEALEDHKFSLQSVHLLAQLVLDLRRLVGTLSGRHSEGVKMRHAATQSVSMHLCVAAALFTCNHLFLTMLKIDAWYTWWKLECYTYFLCRLPMKNENLSPVVALVNQPSWILSVLLCDYSILWYRSRNNIFSSPILNLKHCFYLICSPEQTFMTLIVELFCYFWSECPTKWMVGKHGLSSAKLTATWQQCWGYSVSNRVLQSYFSIKSAHAFGMCSKR